MISDNSEPYLDYIEYWLTTLIGISISLLRKKILKYIKYLKLNFQKDMGNYFLHSPITSYFNGVCT